MELIQFYLFPHVITRNNVIEQPSGGNKTNNPFENDTLAIKANAVLSTTLTSNDAVY